MTDSQLSGSEILLKENQKLRNILEQNRKQKEQANRMLRKTQGQYKALQMKMKNMETQKQRLINDNRRFMQIYQTQKKQKIKYLTQASQAKSTASRSESQLTTIKTRFQNITQQCERLKRQIQSLNKKQVQMLKEKQNQANSIKILQAKLQAAQLEKKYNTSKAEQLETEKSRLMGELSEITKKYHQKGKGAEAIIRDQEETKQKLLGQFQKKISIKDEQMKEQLQAYIKENSKLKQQIIQLQMKRMN